METQPTTVTTVTTNPPPDGLTPPMWLIEDLGNHNAFTDADEPSAIRVSICRNCQCALSDCLCEDVFVK